MTLPAYIHAMWIVWLAAVSLVVIVIGLLLSGVEDVSEGAWIAFAGFCAAMLAVVAARIWRWRHRRREDRLLGHWSGPRS